MGATVLQWVIPILVVAAVLALLYRRGGGRVSAPVKARTAWAVALTTLSGESGLQPIVEHLKGLGIAVRTMPETVGKSHVWKLMVRSGDLARAREAIARFEMHGCTAH